jgi:hypothetical protein
MMLTRIAVWLALGLVLDHMGFPYTTVEFWCVMGLAWALETVNNLEWAGTIRDSIERRIQYIQAQAILEYQQQQADKHNDK